MNIIIISINGYQQHQGNRLIINMILLQFIFESNVGRTVTNINKIVEQCAQLTIV